MLKLAFNAFQLPFEGSQEVAPTEEHGTNKEIELN